MKLSIFKVFFLIAAFAVVCPAEIIAQDETINLSSPYVRPRTDDKLGGWLLYNPATDTMSAQSNDDTLLYYWPSMKIYNQYDLWGVVSIDTLVGNLGDHAGSIVIEQSPCLTCDVWAQVDSLAIPDEGRECREGDAQLDPLIDPDLTVCCHLVQRHTNTDNRCE